MEKVLDDNYVENDMIEDKLGRQDIYNNSHINL